MRKIHLLLVATLLSGAAFAQKSDTKILPEAIQIRVAVMAAPPKDRENATVYGYSADGKFMLLRQGSNDMICLAPDPRQEGLFVYAYPKRLDPFMSRGRELTAEGKGPKEKNTIREADVKSGKITMPQDPTVLFGYWGNAADLDENTGEIKNALRRYVVYVPYATGESTGLPTQPAQPGMPWLMDAGSYKAHIMINPERMSNGH